MWNYKSKRKGELTCRLFSGNSEGVSSNVTFHSFPRAGTVATFLPCNLNLTVNFKHFIIPSLFEDPLQSSSSAPEMLNSTQETSCSVSKEEIGDQATS